MKKIVFFLVVFSLVLAACSGNSAAPTPEMTQTAVPTAAPASTVQPVTEANGSFTVGAASATYLQTMQSQTGELVAPQQIFRNADDENGTKHWVVAVGNLYDLPQCYEPTPIEDFCAKKTARKFFLDDGYINGPGAGAAHLRTFADVKTLLLANGYTEDSIVKIVHSPFIHATGHNPLHPGEATVRVGDLDKVSGLGFVFTFAFDATIPLWPAE